MMREDQIKKTKEGKILIEGLVPSLEEQEKEFEEWLAKHESMKP